MNREIVTWQEVVRADGDLAGWGHMEPVKRAEANGHTVEHDPPGGLTSGDRWTCTACGSAVMIYNRNIYGSAIDRTCEESQVLWRSRGYLK